jgi:hypothetical protein
MRMRDLKDKWQFLLIMQVGVVSPHFSHMVRTFPISWCPV